MSDVDELAAELRRVIARSQEQREGGAVRGARKAYGEGFLDGVIEASLQVLVMIGEATPEEAAARATEG